MTYTQITSEERYMLARLRKQGYSLPEIGVLMGRDRTSIWREVKRNSCHDGRYRVLKARQRAENRRLRSRRNRRLGSRDWAVVESKLCIQWSPEQIASRLGADGSLKISHESIYRHIWADKKRGGLLYLQLRGARKQRRKRHNTYDSRGRLAGKRNIAERCLEAEERSELGHWEIDTVMGGTHKDCIVTLVDRKARVTLIGKLADRTKKSLSRRVIMLIRSNPHLTFQTITADNGTEFHAYKKIEKATGVKFYFANPHHSWERGTNENTNGLIRQYLPKRQSMLLIDQWNCNEIAKLLNQRPRKVLGFRTPEEECYDPS